LTLFFEFSGYTDIARYSDRHIQLFIRAEFLRFPAVSAVRWEIIVHHNRFRQAFKICFDVIITENPETSATYNELTVRAKGH